KHNFGVDVTNRRRLWSFAEQCFQIEIPDTNGSTFISKSSQSRYLCWMESEKRPIKISRKFFEICDHFPTIGSPEPDSIVSSFRGKKMTINGKGKALEIRGMFFKDTFLLTRVDIPDAYCLVSTTRRECASIR